MDRKFGSVPHADVDLIKNTASRPLTFGMSTGEIRTKKCVSHIETRTTKLKKKKKTISITASLFVNY